MRLAEFIEPKNHIYYICIVHNIIYSEYGFASILS